MKAVCVDDERLLMEDAVSMLKQLDIFEDVKGFTRSEEALRSLEVEKADLALLDIDMPGMNGLELAMKIKNKWPETAVIFLTGYSEYAVDAFALRASGYLLKPISLDKLKADVDYALSGKRKSPSGHIMVRTFGNFDVYVDDKAVSFKMAKCKELLAFLVDKQGTGVSRAEVSSILWEDRLYDRKMQKQLDVYIRSLRESLKEFGIEEIFDMQKGSLRVVPEKFVCDAYQFFSGDSEAVNSYRGEYMNAYSWASMTESMMYWKVVDTHSNDISFRSQ